MKPIRTFFTTTVVALLFTFPVYADREKFDADKMLSDLESQLNLSGEKLDKMKPALDAKSEELKKSIHESVDEGFMQLENLSTQLDTASKEAEAKMGGLLSGGTGFMAGILVGGVGGAVATATHYRKKITDMEERFGAMEASLAETEKTLKKEAEKREKEAEERAKEKRAENAVKAFDNRLNLDASFLSNFNGNNGPKY